MIDVGETLTRKLGPLPVWAWGAVVGGSIVVVRAVTGDKGASSPFVKPLADAAGGMDFDPGSGGGGGSAPGATPTPAPVPTPTPLPVVRPVRYYLQPLRTNVGTIAGAFTGGKGGSGTLAPAPSATTGKIGSAAGPVGDTEAFTVPTVTIPERSPIPLGAMLALPVLDPHLIYWPGRPTLDTSTPIVGSGRVAVPSFSQDDSGSRLTLPNVPLSAAGPNRLPSVAIITGAFRNRKPIRYYLPEPVSALRIFNP